MDVAALARLEDSGGTGGGVFDAIWNIPNFFIGVGQVFTDAVNNLYSLIPNPDPFPQMINNLTADSANYQIIQTAAWWLDDAYDLLFIRDMLGYYLEMWAVAVGIMLVWKIINFIRG